MEYNSPLSEAKERLLISLLELNPGQKVYEIGCGEGRLLNRILAHSDAIGLGIDTDVNLIEKAIKDAQSLLLAPNRFEYKTISAGEIQLDERSVDLVICNGSSHALGVGEDAYKNTLLESWRLLKEGGTLFIGEAYWKKKPEQDYLQFIGEPVGVYNGFQENIFQAETYGYDPYFAIASTDDEWDMFEWSHKINIEKQIKESPDDSHLKNKRNDINSWLNAYLNWGRGTMGYGFYLFRKPSAAKNTDN